MSGRKIWFRAFENASSPSNWTSEWLCRSGVPTQQSFRFWASRGLVAAGDGKEVRAAAMIWDTGSKTGEVTGHTKQARSRPESRHQASGDRVR